MQARVDYRMPRERESEGREMNERSLGAISNPVQAPTPGMPRSVQGQAVSRTTPLNPVPHARSTLMSLY